MNKILLLILFVLVSAVAIAGTTTTRYGFYKPDISERNWGTLMNGNFDTLDSTIYTIANTSTSQWTTSGGTTIYYNGGNVGIGTASPNHKLTVAGNIGVGAGNAVTPAYNFIADSDDGMFYAGSSNLAFSTDGIERLRISVNNIGINTVSPSATLEVNGGAGSPIAKFGISNSTSITFDRNGNIGIGTASPRGKLDVGVDGFIYGNGSQLTGLSSSSSQWTTNGSAIYYTGGNVGIGVTSPTAPLVVQPATYTYGTGGDSVYNYDAGGGNYYRIHKFTTVGSATFVPPTGLGTTYEVLAIGGGGAGAGENGAGPGGGGGGGGGYVYSAVTTITSSTTVTVGAGGAIVTEARGYNGNQSNFGSTVVALGGGAGGTETGGVPNRTGGSGGCGGGSVDNGNAGGAGSQGYKGGDGYSSGAGGGGGAGAAGTNGSTNAGGAGGAGLASSITGSSVTYAGGGGGGSYLGSAGAGSSGGGGAAGTTGTAGTDGLGGGGGGRNSVGGAGSGGKGGSGIVIVRYLIPSMTYTQLQSSTFNGAVSVGKSTSASASLEIQGSGTTTSKGFQVTNSSGTALFSINDAGSVEIGSLVPRVSLDISGSMTITGDASFAGKIYATKNATAVGQAACITTAGAMGYCTSVVGAGGACTCTAF